MNITIDKYEYEVVDKIPPGYVIWDIGSCMGSDEHIPLCITGYNGNPYAIDPNSLKAIRLNPDEVKLLRKAAAISIRCLEDAEKISVSKTEYLDQIVIAKKVLPIFKRLSEERISS